MVHLKSSLSTIPQEDILAASRKPALAQAVVKPASNFRKPGPAPTPAAQNPNSGSSSNATAASFQSLFGGAQTASASPSSTTSSTTSAQAAIGSIPSQQSMDVAASTSPAPTPTVESVFGSSSPWLADPTGTSPNGTTFHYNPEYFATPQAAAQVAAMLGGQVVQQNQFAPNGSPFGQQTPNEMVQMPDGGLINAGLVAGFFTHGYPQSVVDQMIANTIANT